MLGTTFWLTLFLSLPAPARLLTTAVGRVKDHVVTSREVQMNQAVEQALHQDQKAKIKVPQDPDSPSFAKQVTAVLLEWVVHLEAKNMVVAEVAAAEMASSESQVKSRLLKNEEWKSLKVTERELEGVLRRKLQAKKFIRFRADSSVVPISDMEAQRYFEQNRLKFGALPFDNFRAQIRSFLAKQQVEKRLRDWFEVLQAKYQVRNFLAEI